jgi:carboxyl-terminal processing protease
LKGVIPDIVLPDQYEYLNIGEKDEDYPLTFDEINKADYTTWKSAPDMHKLKELSLKRVENNQAFTLIESYAKRLKNERDNQVYSLNLKKFKDDIQQDKLENKKNDEVTNYKSHLNFVFLSDDVASWESDTLKRSKAETWKKQLQKDVYLEEAVNVMQDLLQ